MLHKTKIFEMSKELHRSGIYFLYSKRKKLVYIGKSVNLRNRLSNHYYHFESFKGHIKSGVNSWNIQAKPFEYFRYCFVSTIELKSYERFFIKNCNPIYNGNGIYFIGDFKNFDSKAIAELMD